MRKHIQDRAREIFRDRVKRRRFRVVLSALSVFVALATIYMLTSPAITMETATDLAAEDHMDDSLQNPTDSEDGTDPPDDGETTDDPAGDESQNNDDAFEETPGDPDLQDSAERTTYVFAGEGLTVTVICGDPSAIPDNAELFVTRVTAQSDPVKYAGYLNNLGVSDVDGQTPDVTAYEFQFVCEGALVETADSESTVTIADTNHAVAADGMHIYRVPAYSETTVLKEISWADTGAEAHEVTFSTGSPLTAYVFVRDSGDTDSEITADDPTPDDPTPDDPTADDPTADDPTADDPTADDPTADDPTPDDPTADDPTADDPTPDDPTADDPTVDDPTADDPTADDPSADDPVIDEQDPDPDAPSDEDPGIGLDTEFTRTEYVFDESGLKVTAVLSDPAALPDDAELFVTRITQENDPERYAQVVQLLQSGAGTSGYEAFSAYDISFILYGEEIEPSGSVNVFIEDAVTAAPIDDDIQVFHVVENGDDQVLEEVPAVTTSDAGVQEIAFSSDSFSTYIVLPSGSSLTYKQISSSNDTFIYTTYYLPDRPLGIAGNFHIVAFGTASLNAHTAGNVLANTLLANVNFGTNNLANELSYIQSYSGVNSTSASSLTHVLAIGSNNTVTLVDNNNAFAINGTKLDKPKNLWQDANTASLPFINLNDVKTQITNLAAGLAAMANANIDASHLSQYGGSSDDSYLLLTNPDGLGVYNITASALSNYSYIGIKGMQTGHNGSVVINVNCAGVTGTIYLPVCELFMGSNKLGFNEVTSFVNGRVIWNFVNCTATINTNLMYATVIAPNATINVNQNLNGTIIGKNVNINSESHRDDYVGKLTDGITVTANKVWLSSNGTVLPSAYIADMSVTFQLYKSSNGGTTKIAYGAPVTLNSTTGWTYSWTSLPSGYTFYVQETAIKKNGVDVTSNYTITYSPETGVTCGTLTVSNKIIFILPETGGAGTAPVTIAGLLLIGVSLGTYMLYRRTAKKRKPPDFTQTE